MDLHIIRAKDHLFQADTVAEGLAFNLSQRPGKPYVQNAPHVEKTAFGKNFYPLRHLHMLYVNTKANQTLAIQLHHSQNIRHNQMYNRRRLQSARRRFHHIGHFEGFSVRKRNLPDPPAPGKDITDTFLLQRSGNHKLFKGNAIGKRLRSDSLYPRYAHLCQTVAVQKSTFRHLLHRRRKLHLLQPVASMKGITSNI